MKPLLFLLTLSCACAVRVAAQETQAIDLAVSWAYTHPTGGDDTKDPAHREYREGYQLILGEKWSDARAKFKSMLAKYPKSAYRDDAEYWSAYALMHTNAQEAARAYRQFIKANARSRYYDDAVADLTSLTLSAPVVVTVPPGDHFETHVGSSMTVTVAPSMKRLERQLRREAREFSRLRVAKIFPPLPMRVAEEEKLDPKTQLKMEALLALGDTKNDEKAYVTLKEVALDPAQAQPLREAAMESLAGLTSGDPIPVFVEIARSDTNADIQSFAIDYIGESSIDGQRKVSLLMDLYQSLPQQRKDQRETIFYAIADVGNDTAVDFLSHIALTSDDYNLRRDAVYYLGSIGGEKARSALYEILKSK